MISKKWPRLLLLCVLGLSSAEATMMQCTQSLEWAQIAETTLNLIATSPKDLARLKARRDWKRDPEGGFMMTEPPIVSEDSEFIMETLHQLSQSGLALAQAEDFIARLLSIEDVEFFRKAMLWGTEGDPLAPHQRRNIARRILTAMRIGQLYTQSNQEFRTRLYRHLQCHNRTRAQRLDLRLLNQILHFYFYCHDPTQAANKAAAFRQLRQYGPSTSTPKIELLLKIILRYAERLQREKGETLSDLPF